MPRSSTRNTRSNPVKVVADGTVATSLDLEPDVASISTPTILSDGRDSLVTPMITGLPTKSRSVSLSAPTETPAAETAAGTAEMVPMDTANTVDRLLAQLPLKSRERRPGEPVDVRFRNKAWREKKLKEAGLGDEERVKLDAQLAHAGSPKFVPIHYTSNPPSPTPSEVQQVLGKRSAGAESTGTVTTTVSVPLPKTVSRKKAKKAAIVEEIPLTVDADGNPLRVGKGKTVAAMLREKNKAPSPPPMPFHPSDLNIWGPGSVFRPFMGGKRIPLWTLELPQQQNVLELEHTERKAPVWRVCPSVSLKVPIPVRPASPTSIVHAVAPPTSDNTLTVSDPMEVSTIETVVPRSGSRPRKSAAPARSISAAVTGALKSLSRGTASRPQLETPVPEVTPVTQDVNHIYGTRTGGVRVRKFKRHANGTVSVAAPM